MPDSSEQSAMYGGTEEHIAEMLRQHIAVTNSFLREHGRPPMTAEEERAKREDLGRLLRMTHDEATRYWAEESVDITRVLDAHRKWVAAGRPGEMSQEEAAALLVTGLPVPEVIEVTAEEFAQARDDVLRDLGMTYAELEAEAQSDRFSSLRARKLWLAIGSWPERD